MTTIITIVVVALVFFVTICVVAFMVWKRETEMRTDSIRAIEYNVEEMLYELTGGSSAESRRRNRRVEEDRRAHGGLQHEPNDKTEPPVPVEQPGKASQDPPGWVRVEPAAGSVAVSEETAAAEDKARENITVFEPVVVPYTSFDRREAAPDEKDGKRGLRWTEVEEAKQQERQKGGSTHSEIVLPDVSETGPAYAEAPEQQAENPAGTPESAGSSNIVGTPESAGSSNDAEPPNITEPANVQEAAETDGPDTGEQQPTEPLQPGQAQPEMQPAEEAVQRPEIQEAPQENHAENGSVLARFLKRRRKPKHSEEQQDHAEDLPEEQQLYENMEPAAGSSAGDDWTGQTVEDLLRDYIGDADSDDMDGIGDDDITFASVSGNYEPVRTGYNIGKSGRKYTAAELEALIKE